ncbi:MAG: AAA family ATPase [Candidatus Omnitrophica bacterium]|nr:AAA family ATPase [Candidatus Omnitrophota bacterium]
MSYYKIIGLQKEPFSTSPDPSLFYLSKEHSAALYRLRISVKLRRGMSLILGDVGAGKTTLSRRFMQLVSKEPNVIIHMILNPFFSDEREFLKEICERFGIPVSPQAQKRAIYYYNEIEHYLFKKGVNEGQTIVLLIDEAQKLSEPCLEVLRGLLNYETNEYKILQLVLVAQTEIVPRIFHMKNFWDRISFKQLLRPLDYQEMREMILYRLKMVGYDSPVQLFTEEAMQTIYRVTNGFPRKVTQLCHDCLEYVVMYNKSYVDKELVDQLVTRESNFLSVDLKGIMSSGTESAERTDARRAVI